MEYLSGENIVILLMAGFSGINLFANYINKKDAELVEIEYPDYTRALPGKTRDQNQIRRTC